MRADLIERLRDPNYTGAMQHLRDAHELDALLNEAADALASQEPAVFIQRDTLDALRKDKHATTTVCSGLLTKPFGDPVPLFTSPVVPVAAKAEAEGWRPTHRHLKSGHLVRVLGIGRMQAANWYSDRAHRPADMRDVVIYEHGGALWARPREEFEDGRFEPLPTGKGDGQP